MLASQAAISIENANLYSRLEERQKELQEEKNKLEAANDLIAQKNEDITASIRYARRIQEAILPETSVLRESFPESFVLYKPKDIVSGDFYWFSDRGDRLLIAAADCTGHGVPGAFMSVLSSNFLNQVVNELGETHPELVLGHLNSRIRTALRQDMATTETADGMDVALISVRKSGEQIEFCGAKRPLLQFRDNELIEHKGDKQSVGGRPGDNPDPYVGSSIETRPGDTVFIFTDGVVDQFGGTDHRKYSTRRFREFLQQNLALPMTQQGQLLDQDIEAWRSGVEQTDDILVIGIRF
jgi:serine phosphatase RsbU (regulator of sigma subunit)